MSKRFIAIILVVTILGLFMPTPTTHAFSTTAIIDAIRKAVKFIIAIKNANLKVPGIFVFGGRITHSKGGCKIKYRVWTTVCYGIFGCWATPFPGFPIPLGGNTIEVGPPISSPKGQMFTFPGITDIYMNKRQGKVGPWALGIGWKPFPIKQINEALKNIEISIGGGACYVRPQSIGQTCVNNFHLDCSDNNENVILKIGTSP